METKIKYTYIDENPYLDKDTLKKAIDNEKFRQRYYGTFISTPLEHTRESIVDLILSGHTDEEVLNIVYPDKRPWIKELLELSKTKAWKLIYED